MCVRKVGDVTITRIEEFEGPGSTPFHLFPDFDPEEFARHSRWLIPNHYEPNEKRLITSFHSWLIRTPSHNILVDTCAGNHKDRPDMPRYHQLEYPYLERLAATGVTPEDIDFVLCTHLHVDHVGWNTRLENGRWVPTFPNAKYVFSQAELARWDERRPDFGAEATKYDVPSINGGVFADSILPVLEAGQVDLVNGEHALGDHLLIQPAPGHTVGSVIIKTLGKQQGVFIGDVMHHVIQVYRPDWNSRFCELPQEALQTRRRVLEECADQDVMMFPTHFGSPYAGRVRSGAGGFSFEFDSL